MSFNNRKTVKRLLRSDSMKDKIETCKRCGRRLKTAKSIELGFGRVCYQKYLEEQAQIGFMDNQMSMEDVV